MTAQDRSAASVLDPDELTRARAYCGWFLGDSEWANPILGAYMGEESPKLREALVERLGTDEAERLMAR